MTTTAVAGRPAVLHGDGAVARDVAAEPRSAARAGTAAGGAALRIEALTCRFARAAAVDDAALSVRPGEHVALVGVNGSGKSTLLRAVLGLHRPAAGRVMVDGREASTNADWAERRRLVAFVPQRQARGRFPLLVDELLASGGDLAAGRRAADTLGVGHLARTPLDALSGGQLQRCFLARAFGALAGGSRLLLADEPTSALDFEGRDLVADLIARLPATVLVATHDRAVAARCHRVVEMANGRLSAQPS